MNFNEKYKNILFDKQGRLSAVLARSKIYPEICHDALQLTEHFDESINVKDRIFCLAHNISQWAKCEVCKKPSIRNGLSFRPFCSQKCSRTPGSSTFIKAQETCIARYGAKSNLVSNAMLQSKRDNGGIGLKNPQTRKKVNDTVLLKYGVKNVFQSEDVKTKIKDTHNTKYGGNYQSMKLGSKMKLLEDYEYCLGLAKTHCMSSICDIIGVASNTVYTYFEKHGITKFNRQRSNMERQLFSFLTELGVENIVQGDRKQIAPYEIDILLPDFSIGIELNGLYWHSENSGCLPSYHLKKTRAAESSGIQLIHIFENEWVLQNEIVKSRISAMLGKSQTKLFARKCELEIIDNKTKIKFLNDNHLQGNAISSINIGLTLNGKLLALATFGKSRFDKNYDYELIRFCTKKGMNVVGAFSKILTYFKRTYTGTIISFADMRWSSGDVYRKNGFKYVGVSKPAYHYFFKSSLVLENRQKYQKHKLASILPEFDVNKSEWQNMKHAGFNRIWDCGNSKWVL
jgi:hypothetical protein